jgi:hypothetical protein
LSPQDTETRAANISTFEIILDDGGHKMHEQQLALGYLFPLVSEGGYFVIEDIHSSKLMLPDMGYAPYYNPEGATTTLQVGDVTDWTCEGRVCVKGEGGVRGRGRGGGG